MQAVRGSAGRNVPPGRASAEEILGALRHHFAFVSLRMTGRVLRAKPRQADEVEQLRTGATPPGCPAVLHWPYRLLFAVVRGFYFLDLVPAPSETV